MRESWYTISRLLIQDALYNKWNHVQNITRFVTWFEALVRWYLVSWYLPNKVMLSGDRCNMDNTACPKMYFQTYQSPCIFIGMYANRWNCTGIRVVNYMAWDMVCIYRYSRHGVHISIFDNETKYCGKYIMHTTFHQNNLLFVVPHFCYHWGGGVHR